jgi:hypothetical protein
VEDLAAVDEDAHNFHGDMIIEVLICLANPEVSSFLIYLLHARAQSV